MIKIERLDYKDTSLEVKITDNSKSDWILLVHGFNDTKETFIFLENFLSKHFNLVAYDHRGHGGSSWNESGHYHYGETLLDLHHIIESYLPEQFFILGHSLGGGLSARYSGLYPEKIKSLILLEGFAGVSPWEKERQRMLNWLEHNSISKTKKHKPVRKKMSLAEATHKLTHIYAGLDKKKIEALIQGLVTELEDGVAWKNDPRIKQMTPLPFPPELSRHLWKQIRVPVILFFGEKTHLRPANLDEIKSHFNELIYYEVPHSGHNMHHDNPEFLIEKIQSHLGLIK